MRLSNFFTPIIVLCFVGCSTTYTVTNYPSIAEFHEDINGSIKDRDVNVVTADSSFTSNAGSRIKEDSLQVFSRIQEQMSIKDVENIKQIQYRGNDEGSSVSIRLKSGLELRAESIKMLPDSTMQFLHIADENIPVEKIERISYETGWNSALTGMSIGFFSGALGGGILGSAGVIHIPTGGNKDDFDNDHSFDKDLSTKVGIFFGALTGIAAGAIIGYIVGWKHIYLFKQ